MNDPDVGPKFDLNRNVRNGSNLLLQSYKKLHIPDPKWYIYLIEKRHIAVNTHEPGGRTLKEYLLGATSKHPLSEEGREKVLASLNRHGGKTAAELVAG